MNIRQFEVALQASMLQVTGMDRDQSLGLLKKKLKTKDYDGDAASRLVGLLGNMPLAIQLAAAFINRQAVQIPHYSKLVSEMADNYYQLSTWPVTHRQISQERPRALDYLYLVSFFSPPEVPDLWLQAYKNMREDEEGQREDLNESQHDLNILFEFSVLIQVEKRPTCKMHTLVQLEVQKSLHRNNSLQRWERRFNLFLDLRKHLLESTKEDYIRRYHAFLSRWGIRRNWKA